VTGVQTCALPIYKVPAVGVGHLGAHHFARPRIGAKNAGLHGHHGIEVVFVRIAHNGKAAH
jgi:hypothetical protein